MIHDQLIEVNALGQVICGWFALCENVADGVIEHPIYGSVPACRRCAEKGGVTLIEGEVTLEVTEGAEPV